ncbi:MAG: aminotransferase [Dehalococcoidia bacterium]|nr:MAG: aminotransferase [Dehalococcoidia bacterium]
MADNAPADPTALYAARTAHAPRFGAIPVVNDSAIRFGGGIPDPATYPIDWFGEAFREVLLEDQRAAWTYGGVAGYTGLREGIAAHVSERDGFTPTLDQFTITNGISQGVALVAQTFLDPGDTVLVEQTSFPGSIGTFRIEGAKIVTVPLDEQGLLVDAVEETLAQLQRMGERVKLLYTIANFQNPTGTVLANERRVRLAALAERFNFIILQDDAYGDIRLGEVRPESLFRLAPKHTIELGTFSKSIGPGLRVGWAMASPAIAAMLNAMRTDMGTTPMMQRLVGRFLNAGAFQPHLAQALAVYRQKLATIVSALEEHCAPYVTWQTPAGGFFLWLRLKRGSAVEMGNLCPEEGVVVNTGRMFFVDNPQPEYFRLSFSFLPAEDLVEGVRRMSRAMARYDATLNA